MEICLRLFTGSTSGSRRGAFGVFRSAELQAQMIYLAGENTSHPLEDKKKKQAPAFRAPFIFGTRSSQ